MNLPTQDDRDRARRQWHRPIDHSRTAGSAEEQDSPPRHLRAAEPVHAGRIVLRLFGIVQAMNLRFDYAAVSVFVAMVLDSLDGRVARMTNTQTAFGAELDSIADMVSFGAAPALIVYEWALRFAAQPAYRPAAAFIYAACAALRLARFNVQIGVIDKRFFNGLPSPAAAAVIAGFVLLMDDLDIEGEDVAWWAFAGHAGGRHFNGDDGEVLQLRR